LQEALSVVRCWRLPDEWKPIGYKLLSTRWEAVHYNDVTSQAYFHARYVASYNISSVKKSAERSKLHSTAASASPTRLNVAAEGAE
jgi:hypothetical protein